MAVMAVAMEAEMLLVQATQAEQVVMMEQVETMLVEQVEELAEVVIQLILEIWCSDPAANDAASASASAGGSSGAVVTLQTLEI
jgi:hypothetical protein